MPDPAPLPLPDADALAASQRLVAQIAAHIQEAGGWIAFDRYMASALYAPQFGYYTGGATKLGSAGDFVTAPEMTPLFARTLATQLAQVLAHTEPNILEFGAGSGVLARDVLAELHRQGVAVRRYAILEPSPQLRARQRACLGAQADEVVHWLDALPDSFSGVVLANEVLDAMPVKLFVRQENSVLERGVCVTTEGTLRWGDVPADDALKNAVAELEAQIGTLPAPYLSEWPQAAHVWGSTLGQWLVQGAAFIIDYGFSRQEYYHPQRATGTLMCHYRHRAHTDPLWLPGLNDITAHVDFTTLAERAQDAGMDVLGYTSQAHFLLNCGILAHWAPTADSVLDSRRAQAVQRLLSEAEMGEFFKVMALGRGLDLDLIGFQSGDRTHRL